MVKVTGMMQRFFSIKQIQQQVLDAGCLQDDTELFLEKNDQGPDGLTKCRVSGGYEHSPTAYHCFFLLILHAIWREQ